METPQNLLINSFNKNLNKKALWFNNKYYSYEQILNYSKKIIFKLKLNNSKKVAILDEKGIYCYSSILSLFLDNKIFVPLNEKFSDEKNINIIKSAKVDTILAGEKYKYKAKSLKNSVKNIKTIIIDEKIFKDNQIKEISLEKSKLKDTAYIFFTSGSTGNPKGVPISNENLSHYLINLEKRYSFNSKDRFSNNFDITFDLFLHDFLLSWINGGTLFVPDKFYFFNPTRFIKKHKITCWFSVPSLGLNMLNSKQLKSRKLHTLKYSAFCGEALPELLVNKWQFAAPKSKIDNLYGPTETTLAISGYRWVKKKSSQECLNGIVPIGKLFKNNNYLKYKKKKFELILRGKQVFEGYLNSRIINKKKFIKIKNLKYFKTGDLVKINKFNNFLFLGRLDRQIKVRGFRIEPQEIENKIKKILHSRDVVVMGWPPVGNSKHSYENIVVFLKSIKNMHKIKILKKLKKNLSFNQIPEKIMILKKFKYNINKKVDYNYLTNILKNENLKRKN